MGEDGKPAALEAPTHETCSTHIFWANEVQNRPGVVPLHSMNGGNAAAGGQHNPLKKRRHRKTAPEAEASEMESDGGDGSDDRDGGDGDGDECSGGSGSGSGGVHGGARGGTSSGSGGSGSGGGSGGGLNMGGGGKQKYRPKNKVPKAGVDSPPVWLEAAVAQFEAAEDRQREKDKEAAEERRQQQLKDVEALLVKYSGGAS